MAGTLSNNPGKASKSWSLDAISFGLAVAAVFYVVAAVPSCSDSSSQSADKTVPSADIDPSP